MMNFALIEMNFVLNVMNFALKMMNCSVELLRPKLMMWYVYRSAVCLCIYYSIHAGD